MLMKMAEKVFDPYWRANDTYRWGAYEICCSALCVTACLLLIAALTLGILELIGFKSLTQFYGFIQS